MAEVASAWVSLIPSAKGFGSKLTSEVGGEVDASGKKVGSRLGTAMKTGLLAGGAALGVALASTIGSASEAQQAVGGVESVFGKYADTVLADSKRAAQGLGLSATAYNELITVSGAMLKNKGIEDFAAQSKNLITVGADLSAQFGGSTKDAVAALNAAMRGESDPIERYGISLNETAVNAQLAATGQNKLTGAALEQAKTQARLSLIMQQSADAQGAFGRESNTLAGQQARLAAQVENIKASIGTGLLPALTAVAGFVNSTALPAFASFGQAIVSAASFVNNNRTAFAALAAVLATVVVVTQAHTAAMALQAAGGLLPLLKSTTLVSAATKVYAAFQWALNAALTANPIGLVVVAVAALAAGAVLAYKKSETFRNVVDSLWAALKVAGKWIGDVAAKAIDFGGKIASVVLPKVTALASFMIGNYVNSFKLAIAIVGTIIGKVIEFGGALVEGVGKVAKFATGVGQKIGDVLQFFALLPAKVLGYLTSLGTQLYAAGGKLVSMIAAGIRAKAEEAIGALRSVADRLKGLLPGSPVKWGPLTSFNNGAAGAKLMGLVEQGIKKGGPKAVEAARSAFGKIGDALATERDRLQGVLDGLKSDFASLADSVKGAFVGDLFSVSATDEKSAGQGFLDNLTAKKTELTGMLDSFRTLVGWGIPAEFLSKLFASGNGALITDLAAMGQSGAASAASLFGEVVDLGGQLGNAVASNTSVAAEIVTTNTKLDTVITQLAYLNTNIATQIPKAVEKGSERGAEKGAQKGAQKGNNDRSRGAKQRRRGKR